MVSAWMVSVGGQSYGPYTGAQMQAFIAEGRLTSQSLVARLGETHFRPVAAEPEFSAVIPADAPAPVEVAAPDSDPAVRPVRSEEPQTHKFGAKDAGELKEACRLIVVTDMKSGSIATVEQEILRFGPAFAVLPQVWILQSDVTAGAVKNILIQKLGKLDKLLVFDATRDKAAWFNFSPEAEARIRRIWTKTGETSSKRAAS